MDEVTPHVGVLLENHVPEHCIHWKRSPCCSNAKLSRRRNLVEFEQLPLEVTNTKEVSLRNRIQCDGSNTSAYLKAFGLREKPWRLAGQIVGGP